MTKYIPVNTPLLDGNEKKYVSDCIETGWISSEGQYVKDFEKNFSKIVDRKYACAVTNGTAALDVSFDAIGLSEGDEVILPSFTIISCIHQIIKSGATPILVDSDINTWNMNVSEIESKISKNTKAILIVHIYGITVDVDPILQLAKKYNLIVIEDAAEVIGQTYKGRQCGSFGDISTFSFYPNKHITTGEGGMVLTNNKNIYDKVASLRNLCFQPKNRFVHERLGWNLRMTNIQAAIGVAQLESLDRFIKKKRLIGNLYDELLSDTSLITTPLKSTSYCENIYWVYGILISKEAGIKATNVMQKLHEKGIGTRPFFYPMHLQPVLKKLGFFKNEEYPVAKHLYDYGFYLPSGLGLEEADIEYVSKMLIDILNETKYRSIK